METNKTHWRKCDKSDYLGAADLDEAHGDINLVIERVEMLEVNPTGTKEQLRRVAYFKGDTKPMIINVYNGKILKKFTGSKYIEDWKNINVTIYIQEGVKFAGEITEGLRFRDKPHAKTKEQLTKDHARYSKVIEALVQGNTDIDQVKKIFEVSEEVQKELEDAVNIS